MVKTTIEFDIDGKTLDLLDEYADKNILSNITNLFLKPASCSQI